MIIEKYEYKTITPSYDLLETIMNKMAKEDWEFVAVIKTDSGKELILLRKYKGFKTL